MTTETDSMLDIGQNRACKIEGMIDEEVVSRVQVHAHRKVPTGQNTTVNPTNRDQKNK
jgi:hypothetical protein